MKRTIALAFISALVLAGCTRPVVKETTVVERPVVKETIVERPAAAGATVPSSCTYASQSFSNGALSCQDRTEFRCSNGSWTRTFTAC